MLLDRTRLLENQKKNPKDAKKPATTASKHKKLFNIAEGKIEVYYLLYCYIAMWMVTMTVLTTNSKF